MCILELLRHNEWQLGYRRLWADTFQLHSYLMQMQSSDSFCCFDVLRWLCCKCNFNLAFYLILSSVFVPYVFILVQPAYLPPFRFSWFCSANAQFIVHKASKIPPICVWISLCPFCSITEQWCSKLSCSKNTVCCAYFWSIAFHFKSHFKTAVGFICHSLVVSSHMALNFCLSKLCHPFV